MSMPRLDSLRLSALSASALLARYTMASGRLQPDDSLGQALHTHGAPVRLPHSALDDRSGQAALQSARSHHAQRAPGAGQARPQGPAPDAGPARRHAAEEPHESPPALLDRGALFALTSRETVEGLTPSDPAISPKLLPASSPASIDLRSARVSCLW